MNSKEEIWKDIIGYEGLYQVSSLGRVKSLNGFLETKKGVIKPRKERILCQSTKKNGYKTIMFSLMSKQKRYYIHRLVAIAFIPNKENKLQVNHINGIKDDNCIENLEWCTFFENTKHAMDNNLIKKGEQAYCSKLTEKKVLAIRRLYKINPNFHKTNVAKKLGVRDATIHKIINNTRWKHLC
jgi:hypothetical protein